MRKYWIAALIGLYLGLVPWVPALAALWAKGT